MPCLRCALLLLVLGAASPAARAQQPTRCDTLFTQAEAAFFEGQFEETIRLLTPCAAPGAPRPATVAAYRLLSMAHMNRGDAPGAREAIATLLLENPTYEADPIQDPPAYVVLVSAVREQLRAEARLPAAPTGAEVRPRKRLLAFVGATVGLLAVSVAAYLVGEPSL